jgi:hypothetical protein
MNGDLAESGRDDAPNRYGAVKDEFGAVLGIGSISVRDLVYQATEEFAAGPPAAALARLAHDSPDPAEGRLLALRYITAARAQDAVTTADITQALGVPKLVAALVRFVTAAWTELGFEPEQLLASLTDAALVDVCTPATDA